MKQVKDIILEQKIGNGQFGDVYQGLKKTTDEVVAVKQIQKSKLSSPKLQELFRQEVMIMRYCKGDNIVRFIDYIESQTSYYLVMEYCNNGDLGQYIRMNNYLHESEAIGFMQQLLNGFKTLHEQNLVHRDIKCDNIFMNDQTLKIGDLGFAKQVHCTTDTKLGTPLFMAPEIMEDKKYDNKVDLYSLGCIFYNMLFGVVPYHAAKNRQMLLQMIKLNKPNLEYNGIKISSQAKKLLSIMLNPNPSKRNWEDVYTIMKDMSHQQQNDDMNRYFVDNCQMDDQLIKDNITFYRNNNHKNNLNNIFGNKNNKINEPLQSIQQMPNEESTIKSGRLYTENDVSTRQQQDIRQQIQLQTESIQQVRFYLQNLQKRVAFYIYIEQTKLNGDLINDVVAKWLLTDKIYRIVDKTVKQLEFGQNYLDIENFKVFMKSQQQKQFVNSLVKQFKGYHELYSLILPEVKNDIDNLLQTNCRQQIWNFTQLQYAIDDYDGYGKLYFNSFMVEFIKAIQGNDRNSTALKLDLIKMLCIDNGYDSGADIVQYDQQKRNKHVIELRTDVNEKIRFLEAALIKN